MPIVIGYPDTSEGNRQSQYRAATIAEQFAAIVESETGMGPTAVILLAQGVLVLDWIADVNPAASGARVAIELALGKAYSLVSGAIQQSTASTTVRLISELRSLELSLNEEPVALAF